MQRKPWMRIAATVSAMLIVLLLAASWRFFQSRGVFTSVEEKTPGPCRTVPGIGAVADMAAGRMTNAVYIAADDGLYLYGDGKAVSVLGTPKTFHPTALSLDNNLNLRVLFRQEGTWEISVFTVKRAEIVEQRGDVRSGGQVTITRPVPPEVRELGRISTDVLADPAALVSVDADRFYLVNRHGTHTAFGRWLDDTFLLPSADVLYFDGMKFVTVAARLNSPAGLALSKDSGHLTVSQDYPRSLASFTRDEFMGSLDNPAVMSIAASPRKITLGSNGALIVAAKPKAGAGQVYFVTVENGVPEKAELLYSHKGEEVTAAAQLGSHLLVGTTSKLLDCRLSH